LDRFVARSTDALDALSVVTQWKSLLSWFEAHIVPMVDHRQVVDEGKVRWEHACQSRVIDRLRGLSRLDGVGITFDLTTASEVVGALGRTGGPSVEHRGIGVEWMGIDDAATADVEYLAILGIAEGTYPRTGGELGERPLVGGMVSSLHTSLNAKEAYALHVAMRRAKRVEVSMARAMDRTRRGEVGWSRYVALGISADHMLGLDDRPDRAVYSTYRHALSDRMPLTISHYALRALARNEDPRRRDRRPSWDPTGRLMDAAQVIEARERSLAGAFDGVVDPQVVAALGSRERPLSVSAIEHFASCPYGFFVRHVLHAPAPDRVEFTFGLGPADLGMVVHDTMEAIVNDERFDALSRSTPAEVRDQLIEEHLSPRYEEVCVRGLGGARSLWRAQYLRLVDQVGLLCDGLVRLLSEGGANVVHHPEVTFGDPIPLEVALGEDDSVSLRGRVDYLGVGSDRVVVVDYKTGSAESYARVSEHDPTHEGRKFQLGVYLHAARSLLGDDADRSMVARYLFSRRGDHRKVRGFLVTESTLAKVDEALGLLVGAMRDGVFLPDAHGPNDRCDYCVMRDLAVGVGSSQLRLKLDDPRASALVKYLALRKVASS
ncbi:MAG: PD-(D/E)XK nuclease family protein, partial [Acidimicrobiales bacterium]